MKMLQESYLGKVKIIYIDPPYNTGSDFVYQDDFAKSSEEYAEESGQLDENGNHLFKNTDSNGRFHSDWCSMMYSRLSIARNILSEDGVIFISIDDNEESPLKMICDEIFGASNFVGCLILQTATDNNPRQINTEHEYVLCYANRGSKYIVWRCSSHLHEKKTCNSRTVREDVLQDAFLEAVNQIVGNSREYLKILQQNLELAIKQVNPASVEYLDARMEDLQRELIDRTERHENYDDLAEEILRLRQLREQTVMDDVSKAEYQSRIKELQAFIQSQPKRLTFDDTLVKHLLAKITIFPEHLLFEFKSGVNITIEK